MINKVKSPLRFSVKVLMALVALNLVFFACSGPVQQDDGLKDDVVFMKIQQLQFIRTVSYYKLSHILMMVCVF